MENHFSWIFALLSEVYFNSCVLHESSKKNERNTFCVECSLVICANCFEHHNSHRLLQVRRYAYNEVVRLDEMENLFDCKHVQSYTSNKAKVVFLVQKPQNRSATKSSNVCLTCNRKLQEQYHFCSVGCKVLYLLEHEGSLSRYLFNCDYMPMSDFRCNKMKRDNKQKASESSGDDENVSFCRASSISSTNGEDSNLTVGGTTVVTKKMSKIVPPVNVNFPNTFRPANKRRKTSPVRSPFF